MIVHGKNFSDITVGEKVLASTLSLLIHLLTHDTTNALILALALTKERLFLTLNCDVIHSCQVRLLHTL